MEDRIKKTVKFMTESLLGIDSVAGCTWQQQMAICEKFAKGALYALGFQGEKVESIIEETVAATYDQYNDWSCDGFEE